MATNKHFENLARIYYFTLWAAARISEWEIRIVASAVSINMCAFTLPECKEKVYVMERMHFH